MGITPLKTLHIGQNSSSALIHSATHSLALHHWDCQGFIVSAGWILHWEMVISWSFCANVVKIIKGTLLAKWFSARRLECMGNLNGFHFNVHNLWSDVFWGAFATRFNSLQCFAQRLPADLSTVTVKAPDQWLHRGWISTRGQKHTRFSTIINGSDSVWTIFSNQNKLL